MIVLTSVNESRVIYTVPGDEFRMTVKDMMGSEVLIREEIITYRRIDYIASYRFCLEDGTCPGFHLCGIFGSKAELPKEMKQAVRIEDLTEEQHANLVKSVGVKIKKPFDTGRLRFDLPQGLRDLNTVPLVGFCPSA